jgi:hypothetical protein
LRARGVGFGLAAFFGVWSALPVQWNPQKRQPPDRPMTIPALRVQAHRGEIVITASDSDYVVTYHKPDNSPQLIAKSYPRKEDRRVSMTLAEFLTAAWKLANNKARELGWIV